MTLIEKLNESDAKKAQGAWLPACGGTEVPFESRSGRRLLYVWQSPRRLFRTNNPLQPKPGYEITK